MEQKTPLYENHVQHGGKIVPFAGYLLPVQYGSGVIAEHMAVRTSCGLFDVSHMGEITCIGPDAVKNLNHLLTNDYTVMYDGQARYSPMCNESGGVVDDLIVYKVRDDHYFIVVNAANKDKDFAWMQAHAFGDAVFTDISAQVAQIALQGTKAETILRRLVSEEDIPQKYYSAKFHRKLAGMDCIISRTGYTGEDGFEFYLAAEEAPKLWELLLETGKDDGLIPCGLGARDTLRLEAAMPLYGHEMDDEITPFEAGLGVFVKMNKKEFIGKAALESREGISQSGEERAAETGAATNESGAAGQEAAAQEAGTAGQAFPLRRRRVGLKVTGRGIVREHSDVYVGERKIGVTTSGTHCPYLKAPAAMALLETGYTEVGTPVEVDVRGRRVAAEVVKLPFYKRK